MSVHVSSWVWKHADAKGNHLLVMLALADVADDDGIAWPSQAHLASKTRLSLATIKRTVRSLRDSGLIVSDATLGRSNVYRIVMTGGSSLGDPSGGQSDTSVNLTPVSPVSQGVGHSRELGGGSTVTPYTSVNRQDPSQDEGDVVPKGSRSRVAFPDPFNVSMHMREWAAEKAPSVDVNEATWEFVAYWREGEGKGRKMKNWSLTWMNRMTALHKRNVDRGWKPPADDEKPHYRGGRRVS